MLAKTLTEKLDKCTPQQRLLLKTASSVITFVHRRYLETQKDKKGDYDSSAQLNATFKMSYVEACHPVDAHKAKVSDDVDELVQR